MKKVAATQGGRWKAAEYKKFEIPGRKRERLIQAPAFSMCMDRAIRREVERRCRNAGTTGSTENPTIIVESVEFQVNREQLILAREEIAKRLRELGLGTPRRPLKGVRP